MLKVFNPVLNKRAQILMPALLLIPTFLLVIYLLFETAKLSREKIRHQFALDTAAFVELTSASNFLNATAYTNGAFPFRLFRENFEVENKIYEVDETVEPEEGEQPNREKVSIFDVYYSAGAFPGMSDPMSSPREEDVEWQLRYYGNSRPGWNQEEPEIREDQTYDLMSAELAKTHMVGPQLDSEALQLYIFMYFLLHQIYENQKAVYLRIVSDGEFFRKGYYLNVGNCSMSECGREGALEFQKYVMQTTPVFIRKIGLPFKHYSEEGSLSYREVTRVDLDLEEEDVLDGRLFQFAFLTRETRDKLRELYTGIDINQQFKAPSNYFNINLARFNPHTHVRVALQCTKEANNCVWPNPTPKYQVRIFP
ncbi:MAG: hypothetical protein LBR90_01235 [Elusimicrobiota bacterium]|jgi:hypothetical protein|nr:hypothetical protein [Elusimicrobiota bacterium]